MCTMPAVVPRIRVTDRLTEGIARYAARQVPRFCGTLIIQATILCVLFACYRASCWSDNSCVPLSDLVRSALSVSPSHLAVEYRFST